MTTKIVHDLSAIDALEAEFAKNRQDQQQAAFEERVSPLRADELRAQGEKRLKTGLALLAGGTGVAAVLAAASLLVAPKIVTTERLVVQERVVTVDKPVITEKVVTVPAPAAPAPRHSASAPKPADETGQPLQLPGSTQKEHGVAPLGAQTSEEQFTTSREFRTANISGHVVSHVDGKILFDNGEAFVDAREDGSEDHGITTDRHNGDWAYCRVSGSFPTGAPKWECRVFHGNVVENLSNPPQD